MNHVAELHRPATPDSTLADGAPRPIRRRLEVYREPRAGRYRPIAAPRAGSVTPLALPEGVIDLAALSPAPPFIPDPHPAPASRT